MQNWMIVIGALVLFFGAAPSFTDSTNDDDEWDASEMNKEGMNYKD